MLTSQLDARSRPFCENAEAMRRLVEDLRREHEKASVGGLRSARERHVARSKLSPRERARVLLRRTGVTEHYARACAARRAPELRGVYVEQAERCFVFSSGFALEALFWPSPLELDDELSARVGGRGGVRCR